MSRFFYNDIPLSYILTDTCEWRAVYNDLDATEFLYYEVTLQIQAWLNCNFESGGDHPLPPSTTGETPAQTLERIREALMQPRAQLEFYSHEPAARGQDDPAMVIFSPIPFASTDAKNGPYPQDIQIRRLGANTFGISYKIVTYIRDCPPGNEALFTSHRWRTTMNIDADTFLTTRTISGKIVIRADGANDIEALRDEVTPDIPDHFKRKSLEFVVQEDGLAMMYTIVDQEVYLQPPSPSIRAEGRYIESFPDGAQRFAECRVRLWGARDTSKTDLIKAGIQICVQKISGNLQNNIPFFKLLVGGSISEDLYNNEIEVVWKTIIPMTKGNTQGAPINLQAFDNFPAGSEPETAVAPDPGTRGTGDLTALVAFLLQPCSQPSQLTENTTLESDQNTPNNDFGGDNAVTTAFITPLLPDDQNTLYQGIANIDGVYTDYQINCRYETDKKIFQFGTASDDPTQQQAAFTQVAGETMRLIATWSATKMGAKPDLPDPDLFGDNFVLMSDIIEPGQVEADGDGSLITYKISGEYIFGIIDPSQVQIFFSLPPWMADQNAEDMVLDDSDFIAGIVGGTSAP